MRLADYLMARLADEGVREVFFLPGGGAMYLNDGLACEKRLNPVPCHHEQACGIAAEAWGRMNGSFGVALVTTGPGATNVVTPVAGAWIESVPMLVVSGQVKRSDRVAGRPLRQGGVQEVDIVSLVRPITKYAVTVDDPADIRYQFERALHLMREGRPGPVWLDIPLDVQGARIEPQELAGYVPERQVSCAHIDAAAGQTMELLASAERPLLLAGHGVRIAGAAQRFLALAERLDIPVVTTWNALDLIPWEHPLCVGRPGTVALRAPNFAVQNCDLLLAIGSRLDNVVTAYNPRGFARSARKVIVDVDPHELNRQDFDGGLRVAADAGVFMDALAAYSVPPATHARAAWKARCADWKGRYATADEHPFPASGPIGHYHFVAALSEAAPPDTPISTGSSGLAVEAFYTMFRNKPGQRIFLTSGLGAMGYGLPAAIGTCLANNKRPMIAVESDGSLQLNLQELATLKAQHLPICLLLMNNGGYCSIRNTQQNYFEGRFLGTGPEAGLWMPNPEKLAAAYELPFLRIADAADLASGLRHALNLPRPCLVDLRLMGNETLVPKSAAIPQADGSIVSMPLEDMSPLLPLDRLQAEMLIPLQAASFRARGIPVESCDVHED